MTQVGLHLETLTSKLSPDIDKEVLQGFLV